MLQLIEKLKDFSGLIGQLFFQRMDSIVIQMIIYNSRA